MVPKGVEVTRGELAEDEEDELDVEASTPQSFTFSTSGNGGPSSSMPQSGPSSSTKRSAPEVESPLAGKRSRQFVAPFNDPYKDSIMAKFTQPFDGKSLTVDIPSSSKLGPRSLAPTNERAPSRAAAGERAPSHHADSQDPSCSQVEEEELGRRLFEVRARREEIEMREARERAIAAEDDEFERMSLQSDSTVEDDRQASEYHHDENPLESQCEVDEEARQAELEAQRFDEHQTEFRFRREDVHAAAETLDSRHHEQKTPHTDAAGASSAAGTSSDTSPGGSYPPNPPSGKSPLFLGAIPSPTTTKTPVLTRLDHVGGSSSSALIADFLARGYPRFSVNRGADREAWRQNLVQHLGKARLRVLEIENLLILDLSHWDAVTFAEEEARAETQGQEY